MPRHFQDLATEALAEDTPDDDRLRPVYLRRDLHILIGFLQSMEALLHESVHDRDDLFIDELRPLMQAAWHEMPASFEATREHLWRADPTILLAHGLYGTQLAFKIEVVKELERRYDGDEGLAAQGATHGRESIYRQMPRPKRRWFRQLLDAVDNVFDSIVSVLGIKTPIKEFKDGVRSSAKWEWHD
jgi:hypothetical protein